MLQTRDGVRCWEVEVQGEGMWLGLATEHRFGPGYKLAGLLYGGPGNLSDGGALVTGRINRRNKRPALDFTGKWGPKLRDGDRIGMKLEVEAGRALVSFSRNGTGLGTAFDIQVLHSSDFDLLCVTALRPVQDWSGQTLHPVVSLDGVGQEAVLKAVPSLDTTLQQGGAGLEGAWQAEQGWQLSVQQKGHNQVCNKLTAIYHHLE